MSIIFGKNCKICGVASNTGSWDVCQYCQPRAAKEGFCRDCGRKRGHAPECPDYIPTAKEMAKVAQLNPNVSAEDIANNYLQNRSPRDIEAVRQVIIAGVTAARK